MNWASSKDGAMLVDVSSELEGCPASNVLNDDLSTIWLSEEGFPQWLCISLAKFIHVPNLVIRTVGWNCWHPYITNPRTVSMHVSNDGAKFKVWDSFEVPQRTRGTQLFSCAPVDTFMYPYIALEVTRTFGGSQTYMNRVFLYSDEVAASPSSSKDGRSIVDDDEDEQHMLPSSHSNNMSDLSARTPEREPPAGKMSHDTAQLVDQLQDALGLRNALDDSYYYSDDSENNPHVVIAGRETLIGSVLPVEESPATVAGRLTTLEHTVHALEHTLLDRYLHPTSAVTVASAPNVSFAGSPTLPSRSHSRSYSSNHSPSASHTSNASNNRNNRRHSSPSRSPTRGDHLTDEQRVAVVANRLDSIEEKLTRFMETFEKQANAPMPPRPPPPPPPPLSEYHPWSEMPNEHSPLRSSPRRSAAAHNSPERRSQAPQRLAQSTTSLSNATISTKSRSVPGKLPPAAPKYPSAYAPSSPSRAAAPGTATAPAATLPGVHGAERVMEQVVHSVETMMQRVLAQHELKLRKTLSNDSTINSSSLFETPEDAVLQQKAVHHRRSRSRSRSRSSSRRNKDGSQARSRSFDSSLEEERRNGRHREEKRGIETYISENAKRLLRKKNEKSQAGIGARETTSGRAQPDYESVPVAATKISHLHPSANLGPLSGKHNASHHAQGRSDSSVLSSNSGDDNRLSPHRSESKYHARHSTRQKDHHTALLDTQESHNILERSIFELLKSKYGLGVSNETQLERGDTPLSSLPMRVPAVPSVVDGPVVDWPQYVQNRVAVSSGAGSSSSRLGSPLRQRHSGIYSVAGVVVNGAEHSDVLPRAKQSMRDGVRERLHQQAAARDRSVSPLRTAPHESAMAARSTCAALLASAVSSSSMPTSDSHVPAWWERDAEMAELVRSLHEKVYQRTVKEAQYDMLLCATESINK